MPAINIDLVHVEVRSRTFKEMVQQIIGNVSHIAPESIFWTVTPDQEKDLRRELSGALSRSKVIPIPTQLDYFTALQGIVGQLSNDDELCIFCFDPKTSTEIRRWRIGKNAFIDVRKGVELFNGTVEISKTPGRVPVKNAAGKASDSSEHRKSLIKAKAKELRVYAEERARRAVYEAAKATQKKNRTPLTLYRFVRATLDGTNEIADKSNFSIDRKYLHPAKKNTVSAMLKRGVFLKKDGTPVTEADNEFQVRVVALKKDFHKWVDRFMIGTLINGMGDITTDDLDTISKMYFGQGKTEDDGGNPEGKLQDELVEVLFLLGEDGCSRSENGTFSVHIPPQDPVIPKKRPVSKADRTRRDGSAKGKRSSKERRTTPTALRATVTKTAKSSAALVADLARGAESSATDLPSETPVNGHGA